MQFLGSKIFIFNTATACGALLALLLCLPIAPVYAANPQVATSTGELASSTKKICTELSSTEQLLHGVWRVDAAATVALFAKNKITDDYSAEDLEYALRGLRCHFQLIDRYFYIYEWDIQVAKRKIEQLTVKDRTIHMRVQGRKGIIKIQTDGSIILDEGSGIVTVLHKES